MKNIHPFNKKELIKVYKNAPLIELPKYQSVLSINTDLQIKYLRKMPNWWNRLWQKLLLGFEWEEI